MNKKFSLDIETLRAVFNNNRQYIIFISIILIAIVLFFKALMPQFSDLSTTLNSRKDALQKLQVLRNNLILLSNINDISLDANLAIAIKALPKDKDFEAVLNSLSSAANKSGVTLGNFEFKVGDLSSLSSTGSQLPSLSMTILVNSGVRGAAAFLRNLSSSLPLCEIKKVDINGNYTTVDVVFYYKSLPSMIVPKDSIIIPLSSKQLDIVNQLSSWDQPSMQFINAPSASAGALPVATSSASPF